MNLKNVLESDNNSMAANLQFFGAKMIIFISGLFVLAFGAAAVIEAHLGAGPWDVLHIGLAKKGFLSIGAWVQVIGVAMILFASILERKKPQIGSVINILLIGYFLNLILDGHMLPVVDALWKRIVLLIFGIGLMGLGSGMYVATTLGAGPRDGITLLLAKMSGRSIRLVRTGLEVTALFCGWLVGGPISIGTFVVVFLVGPVMQASLYFWRRQIESLENLMIDEVVEETAN